MPLPTGSSAQQPQTATLQVVIPQVSVCGICDSHSYILQQTEKQDVQQIF